MMCMQTIQQTGRESWGRSGEGGFTLVDLLAVCAVIVLVVVLCIPALARTKGQTHRAQCISNLKQFALAHQLYATENGGQLPFGISGSWAWDLDVRVANVFTQWVSWRQLYCPGTSVRFSESDNLVLWGGLNGYSSFGFRVIGYNMTFPGSSVIASNVNATLLPSGNPPPSSSQRVLIADATISLPGQSNPTLRSFYSYTTIMGGYPKPHLSAHLDGRLPIGGNLAMLDGHVEWRDFDKMIPRTQGSSPVFWW
jgi:prepilin-type processing-associated H-X9-DG protein